MAASSVNDSPKLLLLTLGGVGPLSRKPLPRISGWSQETLHPDRLLAEPECAREFDVAVFPLPDEPGGLSLLARLRQVAPELPVLVVLGESTKTLAPEALRAGADDCFAGPVSGAEIERRLAQLLRRRGLARRVEDVRRDLEARYGRLNLVTQSPRMLAVYEQVLKVARSRTTVLIQGESGTGKELIARAIHTQSPRKDGPFVAVNCSAIAFGIIESELFGHERGAFTGAVETTRGKFEQADRGTLYLDEIGEMSLAAQVKLLRALEEGEIMKVGGSRPISLDIRILAATNADLERLVAMRRFREDLYFRLKVVIIDLPPLRERLEDVPLLTSAFMQEVCERNRIPRREITAEALDLLCAYHWPGNVRELKNVVESLCVMTPTRTIDVPDLPAYFTRPGSPPAMAGEGAVSEPASTWNLAALERRAIQGALLAAGGNRREAAVLLGISQRTLYRKLAGIMPPDGAPPAGPGGSGAAPRRARFPRRSGS